MKEPTLYVKISSKSHTWKWERCTWKIWPNKNQLFLGNLPLCIKFCPLKEEIPSVKILENYRFHTREKKNPSVKISLKVSVKILDCPWKDGEKCAWKPVLYPWKNSKKGPKKGFTGTFDFHGEKKNADNLPRALTPPKQHILASPSSWRRRYKERKIQCNSVDVENQGIQKGEMRKRKTLLRIEPQRSFGSGKRDSPHTNRSRRVRNTFSSPVIPSTNSLSYAPVKKSCRQG